MSIYQGVLPHNALFRAQNLVFRRIIPNFAENSINEKEWFLY
jgi:hypothetical protein